MQFYYLIALNQIGEYLISLIHLAEALVINDTIFLTSKKNFEYNNYFYSAEKQYLFQILIIEFFNNCRIITIQTISYLTLKYRFI